MRCDVCLCQEEAKSELLDIFIWKGNGCILRLLQDHVAKVDSHWQLLKKSTLLLVCDPFIGKNKGMKGNFSNISARLPLTVCTMILRFLALARLCASDAL